MIMLMVVSYSSTMYVNSKNASKNKKLNIRLVVPLIVLGIIAILFLLEYTNTINLLRNEPEFVPSPTIGQQTKGEVPTEQQGEPQTDQAEVSPKDSQKAVGNSPGTAVEIKDIAGNFVSSHEVGRDSRMASSCVTSPGVKCTITFIKDGVNKSLNEQVTDREGAAYWEWTPKQIGLSAGEWKIEARAWNDSNSKTAPDALTLKVGS